MLERITQRWSNLPLEILEDRRMAEHVAKWRAELGATPRTADEMIQVLRGLIRFGQKHGCLARDVTTGFKQIGAREREDVFWFAAEIDAFAREAEADGKPQVADAVRLIACTGLGIQDAIALKWSDIRQFTILKPNSGTRKRTMLPRLPELDNLLVELRARPRREGVETVLVDDRGNSWRRSTLEKWLKIYRERAGIWHIDEDTGERRAKHPNDLRKTYAMRLLASGVSEEDVATVMNWRLPAVEALRLLE